TKADIDLITSRCLPYTDHPQQSVAVQPMVTISGPSAVPLAVAGTPNTVDSIQLTATPNPSGGTFSWTSAGGVSILNATSQTVTVRSVSAGSAPVSVTYTLNTQSASASKTISVQQPSALTTLSDTGSTQNFDCTQLGLPYNGVQRLILYRLLDQSGIVAIQVPNISLVESFVPVSNSCEIQDTPTPGNGF